MRIKKLSFVGCVTFTLISPEPEMAAIFVLNLICGHIVAFERAQVCTNRFSHLRENCADKLSVKLIEKTEICRLRYLFGYILGTGSFRHDPFKLDLWPECSFQTNSSLSNCADRKEWDLSITSLVRSYLRNQKCLPYFIYT